MGRQPVGRGLRIADIPPGSCKPGKVGGENVAIFNVDGKLYATQGECTHAGGPLCEGALWGDTVTCPWHGSEFDIRTGEVITGPADEPLKTYRVEVQDGAIVLKPD
jgi:nitrite reductase/ring-hydroxylating ferredoxin subunit